MIAVGAAIAFAVLAVSWALGEGFCRLLHGERHASVAPELRPLTGVAVLTLLLELWGYPLPIRVAAFIPLALSIPGFLLLSRRDSTLRRRGSILLPTLVGLLLGLAPLVVVGRFTAAAMTNNDATFYLAAADRLADAPWAADLAARPDSCLRERLLRGWYWRTGTSNLVAFVSVLARVSGPRAVAVVTALLLALAPAPALSLARALGKPSSRARVAGAGILAGASAAAVFLAYQHLLGQLAAYALFPVAVFAVKSAVARGGARRLVGTAVLLGASVAHFADAAPVLLALSLVAAVFARRPLRVVARRLAALGGLSLAVAPLTLARAAVAAYRTLTVRTMSSEPMFPQRGWIARIAPDHLVTAFGVDPWPPWPTPWPPTLPAVVAVAGVVAAIFLAVSGVTSARRLGILPVFFAVVLGLVAAALLVHTPYVAGKAMLLGAAFLMPVVAAGTLRASGAALVAPVVLVVAEACALAQFLVPSRWTVVDTEADDALVPALARLGAGSWVALDGFGAPADAVLDAHRAFRAAQFAGLTPISAGLDGGFYRPRCADPPRPAVLPEHAYALQRVTSETLSRGAELERFGPFRVLRADLRDGWDFVATFAPRRGFLRVESEPGVGPFRWSEARSSSVLRVVSRSACARLEGELRTAGPEGLATLSSGEGTLFGGFVTPRWSSFTTVPLDVEDERVLDLRFERTGGGLPPDDAHALAVRRLSLVPDPSCVQILGALPGAAHVALPVRFETELRLHFAPAVGVRCGRLRIGLASAGGAELGVSVDGGAMDFRAPVPGDGASIRTDPIVFSRSPGLDLLRRGGGSPTVAVDSLVVEPAPCPE
ncbi:MAG TPA: hypothetical protein VHE30_29000 [Polyangiaceae bacterium]|nr:hypothetical protein [Polyangiaceae bacterium]